MKLITKFIETRVAVISFILSIIVAWMIVPISTGFPMVAFSILFTGLSSLIFILKKNKSWIDSFLYLGVVTLSFFTVYRANEFLQLFDFISIILFISILVRQLIDVPSIFHLFFSPVTVLFNSLTSENKFKYSFSPFLYTKRNNYLRIYVPTIIVTALIILTTIPLLASANPIFNNLLQQIFKMLNIDWLWRFFIADSIFIYIFRILFLLFLSYVIPRSLSVTSKGVKEYFILPSISINYLIPKIAMTGILIIFFVTQFQLYFATPELLQSLGYTNSRLTNEVFAQVTIVAFIVLMLAYLDRSRKKLNTIFTYFLLLEAFFLIGIAFKSVYDYSSLYGFTQKRLWGYASMTWLTGVVCAYIYHYNRQTSVHTFIKQVLAFSVLVIFIINLLNFDNLIYRSAKPSTQAGIDYNYISTRSVDAHYYNEVLPMLIDDILANQKIDESKIQSATRIIRVIERLRNKYSQKYNINSFNFSEYYEYKATNHLNILQFEKIITEKQKPDNQLQSPLLDQPNN